MYWNQKEGRALRDEGQLRTDTSLSHMQPSEPASLGVQPLLSSSCLHCAGNACCPLGAAAGPLGSGAGRGQAQDQCGAGVAQGGLRWGQHWLGGWLVGCMAGCSCGRDTACSSTGCTCSLICPTPLMLLLFPQLAVLTWQLDLPYMHIIPTRTHTHLPPLLALVLLPTPPALPSGHMMINRRPYDSYFPDMLRRNDLLAPFLGGWLAGWWLAHWWLCVMAGWLPAC